MKKLTTILVLVLVLSLGGYIYWKFFLVFERGIKSGQLDYVVLKGDLFKTYEGRLIVTSFQTSAADTSQSNGFGFSVVDKSIAEELMHNSGKYFDLHYREYHGSLLWRGGSRYIVDSIVSMRDIPSSGGLQAENSRALMDLR